MPDESPEKKCTHCSRLTRDGRSCEDCGAFYCADCCGPLAKAEGPLDREYCQKCHPVTELSPKEREELAVRWEDEFNELPRWPKAALAGRCVQRVLPLLLFPAHDLKAETHAAGVEEALNIVAAVSVQGIVLPYVRFTRDRVEFAASSARTIGARISVNVAEAALAALDAATTKDGDKSGGSAVKLSIEAAATAYAAAWMPADVANKASGAFTHALADDYAWLAKHADLARLIPVEFHTRALWPTGEPPEWAEVIQRSRRLTDSLGLGGSIDTTPAADLPAFDTLSTWSQAAVGMRVAHRVLDLFVLPQVLAYEGQREDSVKNAVLAAHVLATNSTSILDALSAEDAGRSASVAAKLAELARAGKEEALATSATAAFMAARSAVAACVLDTRNSVLCAREALAALAKARQIDPQPLLSAFAASVLSDLDALRRLPPEQTAGSIPRSFLDSDLWPSGEPYRWEQIVQEHRRSVSRADLARLDVEAIQKEPPTIAIDWGEVLKRGPS